ncbi:MAG: CoA transferase [Dehalococcoidia bacterium]
MSSAFTGIRVLDFTQAVQGPLGTSLLSDMGADVIKVERHESRAAGEVAPHFEAINRGKRSIVLDLSTDAGCEIVRRLAASSDVVIENFRPGVIERMGFGFDVLSMLRPGIILASASGWGREGPWARRGGYDHVAQALSGVMSQQGTSRHDPQALIAGFADRIGGMILAYAVASALFVRERTGLGQHVDVSLIGSMTQIQVQELTGYLETGTQDGFQRYRSPTYTHYPCLDGEFVAIAANTDAMWKRFCDAIDRPDLRADVSLDRRSDRLERKDELVGQISEAIGERPLAYWLERFAVHDVPHAPVLDHSGVVGHPQFLANEYFVSVEDQQGSKLMPGPPVHMSETPARIQGWAPRLGQHTDEILRECGYSAIEISELREQGAI